jgi:cell division protein FtsZ
VNEAAEVVTSAADQNANVIFGAVIDDTQADQVRVTVIATGFGAQRRRRARASLETAPVTGQRPPEFEPAPGDLDVPSFLRGE